MIEKEKNLEKRLSSSVKSSGGLCLKLLSAHINGLPDRICLFKNSRILFVEVKSTGKTPRRIQTYMHKRIRELGFDSRVVETSEQIDQIIKDYGDELIKQNQRR